ncbi:hypothetical protein BC939DRAFT_473112 [Gamsiella multidivaricata]|uniref:uncharacterized protein n=1 Tax=Gamsiella multidivaricata TaxID=101098 RepID=UPI00221F9BA5|nr:uncharacterized protein BC939DRAFT_473112 [Gamsiella multidivaricata]KAI7831555.1 hypothetical protein BC939DRAFT_473112 [Gamsiella multidivaricata]
MGKLFPTCVTSNNDTIYMAAYATEIGALPPIMLLVLVKSEQLPQDPSNISWSVVSTVPLTQLDPFNPPEPRELTPSISTECFVDDKGLFIMTSQCLSNLWTVQYNPKATLLNNSKTTHGRSNDHPGEWSMLDAISVGIGHPFPHAQFLNTKSTVYGNETLYQVRYIPHRNDSLLTPPVIDVGPMEKNNRTAIDSRPVLLDQVNGSIYSLKIRDDNIYAVFDTALGNSYPYTNSTSPRYNKTLAVYPFSSSVIFNSTVSPNSTLNPAFTLPWDLDCSYDYLDGTAVSAIASGRLYYLCSLVALF